MPATARHKRPDRYEAAMQSRIEMSFIRPYWQSIQKACQAARNAACDDAEFNFVPAFLRKLQEVVQSPGKRIDTLGLGSWSDPNSIPVDGKVCNWLSLGKLILTYGDEFAREAGSVMTSSCSQVVFAAQGGGKRGD